jgi:hypothetical protein
MQDFFATLFGGLLLFGPIRMLRVIRRGSERVAAFREQHGREPTEPEWLEISRQVDEEINGKRARL